MTRPLNQSELVGAQVHWVLRLDFAGKERHFGSRTLDIVKADGTSIKVTGALPADLEVEVSFDFLSGTPSPPSLPIQILWGGNLARLAARGHDLSSATAQLSLWVAGTEYEDRMPVLTGRVRQPRFGPENEPVFFTIEPKAQATSALTHDPTQYVTADTYANRSDNADGLAYPLVFGKPGKGPGTLDQPGSPALYVDTVNSILLINGGPSETAGANVTIYDSANDTTETFATAHTLDGLGRLVTTVDISAAATITDDSDTEYFVRWDDTNGLALNPSRPVNNAYEVALWMLRGSGLDIDEGAWHTIRRRLEAYTLAFYIDEPAARFEWLQRHLLSDLLPLSLRTGADGVYPIFLDMAAGDTSAVAVLMEGRDCTRVAQGGPFSDDSRLYNEVTLSFGYRADTGEYKGTVVVGPKPGRTAVDGTDPANEYGSVWAESSFNRYAEVMPKPVIESDVVASQSVAASIASSLLRFYALPVRGILLQVPRTWLWLRLGMLVQYTNSDLDLTEHRAWVRRVVYRLQHPLVEIAWLDDPTRDPRLTS